MLESKTPKLWNKFYTYERNTNVRFSLTSETNPAISMHFSVPNFNLALYVVCCYDEKFCPVIKLNYTSVIWFLLHSFLNSNMWCHMINYVHADPTSSMFGNSLPCQLKRLHRLLAYMKKVSKPQRFYKLDFNEVSPIGFTCSFEGLQSLSEN